MYLIRAKKLIRIELSIPPAVIIYVVKEQCSCTQSVESIQHPIAVAASMLMVLRGLPHTTCVVVSQTVLLTSNRPSLSTMETIRSWSLRNEGVREYMYMYVQYACMYMLHVCTGFISGRQGVLSSPPLGNWAFPIFNMGLPPLDLYLPPPLEVCFYVFAPS